MITVPQGGTIAGRAAQVQVATPDTGGFIAEIGNAVAQKFGAIKARQEAVVTQRATLDLTREVGEARQEFDRMTDPAQIEAEWPVFVQGLQDKYAKAAGPDGKPLYTPDQIDALGLTIQDLTTRHGLALGDRAIQLTDSQAIAAWSTARLDIVNTAATSDADTMLAMIEIGEKAIDEQLADGIIDMPDKAEAAKLALRQDVYNARAISQGDEDPAGLLADLEAGEFNALGPERIAVLKNAAQSRIDQLAAAEVKAAEAAQTEAERMIGADLDSIAGLAGKGVPIAQLDKMADPAYRAHPKFPETAAKLSLAEDMPGLAMMTPAQLDAAIAAEEASPKSKPFEAERRAALVKMRDEAAKGWATDGAAQAAASGLPIPEVDVTDTENLATGLAQQIAFSGQLAKQGYIKDPLGAVLDTSQRAAIKAATAPEADYTQKIELVRAIAMGTGGNPAALNRAMGVDPVFGEATRVLVETGNESLALRILRGQQKVANGTTSLPTKPNQNALFDAATGGIYDDDPDAKMRAMAAVASLYADGARGLNPDGSDSIIPFMDDDAAKSAYKAAIQEWSGATPDRNGDLTVGGVQPVRDRMVTLPSGIGAEDIETALQNVEDQLTGRVYNPAVESWVPTTAMDGTPFQPDQPAPDPMRAFKAASIDGRVPYLGADAGGQSDILSMLQVEKVPNTRDQYRFVYDVDGRSQMVGDANGLEYRFRLPGLIKGASQ